MRLVFTNKAPFGALTGTPKFRFASTRCRSRPVHDSHQAMRLMKGEEAPHPHNVSRFIQDPEMAAALGIILAILDEQQRQIQALGRIPPIVSAPQSYTGPRR
jgi:hypothetical protein